MGQIAHRSKEEMLEEQKDIYDQTLLEKCLEVYPRHDGFFHGSVKAYSAIGQAILNFRIDKCSDKKELLNGFFHLGKDISCLVMEYKDSGLVMTEPLWLGSAKGGLEGTFIPSPHLKNKSHISCCTNEELMAIFTAYQTGKAKVFIDQFDYETSLRNTYMRTQG